MTAQTATEELAFDTGPLSHFAEQGWLGALHFVLDGRVAVAPDTVIAELRRGLHAHPHLRLVLDAPWIEHRDLTSAAELVAFARFSSLLVAGGRNVGEAGVLAYAKVHSCTAVVDDGAARRAAQTSGVKCCGTLSLLCEAVRGGHLTMAMTSALVDDLIEGAYRLPFPPGGFEKWARDNGQI